MGNPCKSCDGQHCCHGADAYCSEGECCDPFICLCNGLLIKEEISAE